MEVKEYGSNIRLLKRMITLMNNLKTSLSIPFSLLLTFACLMISACDSGQEAAPPVENEAPEIPPVPPDVEVSLVAGCGSCHGRDGVSSKPGVPFLAGQSAAYLESALRSYLLSDRKHDVMQQAVTDLSDDERKQMANYFANLTTKWKGGGNSQIINPRRSKPLQVTQKRIRAGKAISKPCGGCHGADGNSVKAGVPSLAGLKPEYFVPALKAYLTGKRKGASIMKNFKLSLGEEDLRNLAAYFSVQQRERSPLEEKLLKTVPSDALVPRCVGCHGEDGNSTHPAMPSLVGQNASYLIKVMKKYRDARRSNQMMVTVAKGLSDDDIERNATYFATRIPERIQKKNVKQGQLKFDPLADGARLAASCNACHGKKGNNPNHGAPRLAGLDDVYLRKAISEYRDGKRQHDAMKILTEFLTDVDIDKISLYYATQAPEKGKAKLKDAIVKDGLRISGPCGNCHGKDGNSKKPATPSLAGQNVEYLVTAINSYKEKGSRKHDTMKDAVKVLDRKSVRNLAQYYSELDPKPENPRTLEAPEELAKKCDRCHGQDGGDPNPGKPRIAGQRYSYLVSAISAYINGNRSNSTMHKMSKVLWQVEIEAIASYYANQK